MTKGPLDVTKRLRHSPVTMRKPSSMENMVRNHLQGYGKEWKLPVVKVMGAQAFENGW
jgi:hypothetical protein